MSASNGNSCSGNNGINTSIREKEEIALFPADILQIIKRRKQRKREKTTNATKIMLRFLPLDRILLGRHLSLTAHYWRMHQSCQR